MAFGSEAPLTVKLPGATPKQRVVTRGRRMHWSRRTAATEPVDRFGQRFHQPAFEAEDRYAGQQSQEENPVIDLSHVSLQPITFGAWTVAIQPDSNEQIGPDVEELREFLGLRFADGSLAAQNLRDTALGPDNRP